MKKSDLKGFVRERLIELLHKETVDSYRVRNHYSISLMEELDNLLDEWKSNKIKQFETIDACISETLRTLEEDSCFNFSSYSLNLFKDDIESFRKEAGNKGKTEDTVSISSHLINLIDKIHHVIIRCVELNKEDYLSKIFCRIESIISSEEDLDDKLYPDVLRQLDWAVSTLCCALIHQGYSKNHLYYNALKLNKEPSEFLENFTALKEKLLEKAELDHIVVFKIKVNDEIVKCADAYNFTSDSSAWAIHLHGKSGIKYKSYCECPSGLLYYVHNVKALDMYSAIKAGKQSLSFQLDVMNVALSKAKVSVQSQALVIQFTKLGGKYIYEKNIDFHLDGIFANNPSLASSFKNVMDSISLSLSISNETKRRITSALRHLRLGDTAPELEQRFINYWIALEFIFSSPATNENTFRRIKKHLINLLCVCYIKRNVKYLEDKLRERNKQSDYQSLLSLSNSEWCTLIETEKSLLTQWRLCDLKSILRGRDSIKDYVNHHKQNLEWHLIRIYRMRNQLIHEAAITQDIESVTSNLRYYLVFLLNQMVSYFSNNLSHINAVDINDFFIEYEILYLKICENYDKQVISSVEFHMNLLQ